MELLYLNNFQLVQGHTRNLVYLKSLLHALFLLTNLRIAIILITLHFHTCGNTLVMKPITAMYRMSRWKWMSYLMPYRHLVVNANQTESERGIRIENVELRSGNAIEADNGTVILTKIQALVAMEYTSLDLVEGLVEVARLVKAMNVTIQVLILVMLQIIQVGRCKRGWDSERMESCSFYIRPVVSVLSVSC
jgi:hypothetical protein